MKKYLSLLSVLLLSSLFQVSTCIAAQPAMTTLVVPYSTGTGIDAVSRIIAPRLSELLGRPVLVDNKAGASGNIGADYVAKARPDGSVLMITVNTFNVTPAIYKKLPYDPNVTKRINDPHFKDLNQISQNSFEVFSSERKIKMDVPIQVGCAVYD